MAPISEATVLGSPRSTMRTSTDSGATWSPPRLIVPEFAAHHLPSEPVFRMNDGQIAFSIDGPNTVWMSKDEGLTWYNPGGNIPGIHTAVNQLSDGRIIAFSRGAGIEGKMPISLSSDGGKSYTQIPSPFPTVGGGQRSGSVDQERDPESHRKRVSALGKAISKKSRSDTPVHN